MTSLNLAQSVNRLFSALEISVAGEFSSVQSLDDVQKMLRGSGYQITRVNVVKGVFAYGDQVKGGIFFNIQEKTIVPFVMNASGFPLFLDEKEGGARSLADVQNYTFAWVVQKKRVVFDRLSPLFYQYGRYFWDIILSAFLINFFALLFPLFSSFVYDKVMGNGVYETLWALAVCLMIVMGIEYLMRLIRIKAAERFAVHSETDIDFSVFHRLLGAKLDSMPSVAVLLEKYKQILSYRDFLSSSYLISLADIPFLFLFLIAILVTAGPMVGLVVVFGGIMSAVSMLILKPVLGEEAIAKAASEKRFSLLSDLVTSREIVLGKSFADDIETRLRQSSVQAAMSSSRARYWRGIGMSLSNSLSYLSYVAVLVMGVYMVESHQLTSGGLLAVSMLSSRSMTTLSSVAGLILRYREFSTAMKGIEAILPDTKSPSYLSQGKLSGDVRIENLTFKPKGANSPLFDGINLHFKAGEIIGIAGAPGAGKTTLLRIILGLLPADKGHVLIDDVPIHAVSPEDISLSIGYKPQELCLIEGTIEDNVRAGRAPIDSEVRRELLETSGLGYAFQASGLGWQSDVGVRGMKLSGGQRQLVSLARALAYNPSLIILDEPTNGFDSNLETHFVTQLSKIRGKATVVLSSHSHSSLAVCDRIVVLGNGKVLADGPRDQILMPQTTMKKGHG